MLILNRFSIPLFLDTLSVTRYGQRFREPTKFLKLTKNEENRSLFWKFLNRYWKIFRLLRTSLFISVDLYLYRYSVFNRKFIENIVYYNKTRINIINNNNKHTEITKLLWEKWSSLLLFEFLNMYILCTFEPTCIKLIN